MQPRITLILFVYNQIAFVREAALSCLAQVGEPIEILLSDDASSDGSFEVLVELAQAYSGPHQVRVRRNPVNLGIGGHYNQVISEARGELLITAAGDDISLPHRVQRLAQAWDQSGQKVDLIASHVRDMDAAGVDHGVIEVSDLAAWSRPEHWTRKRPYVIGASHAFTKRVHDEFGPFRPGLLYEDQVMAFRAACRGGGLTVNEPLLRYRRGGLSAHQAVTRLQPRYVDVQRAKFTQQKILFEQIRQDMLGAGLSGLWQGKVARYLSRSELMLLLMDDRQARRWRMALAHGRETGWLWLARQWLFFYLRHRLKLGQAGAGDKRARAD
jgi:glycosyltransferase involved in cell wall biosynthesis